MSKAAEFNAIYDAIADGIREAIERPIAAIRAMTAEIPAFVCESLNGLYISVNATAKERHYMNNARKARTRKKYRHRVLRRIRKKNRRHRHGQK